MNDKEIMEGILLTTKGVCDLYMHGAIESSTPNVHQAFAGSKSSSVSSTKKWDAWAASGPIQL